MDRHDIHALQTHLLHKLPHGEHELVRFRRQYLQKLPLKYITFPSSELLQLYDVHRYLYSFLCDPPAPEYRPKLDTDVLAELVKRIESAVADAAEPDIYDPLVELAAELCLRPRLPITEAAQRDVWVTYETPTEADILDETRGIKLLEKPQILAVTGCTGYSTWQASLTLATELVTWNRQDKLKGKRVLELGSGTGLLSFLCAMQSDVELVVGTDGDSIAVERLNVAAEINGLHGSDKISFGVYAWGDDLSGVVGKTSFDIVMGADVTYDPSLHASLVVTFSMLLAVNPSTVIIVGAPVRNQATTDSFFSTCKQHGLATNYKLIEPIPFEKQNGLFNIYTETVMLITISSAQDQKT